MRRTPKSGIFRPSARPFFHQKRGRIALWIHWWTLQLIDIQYSKQFKGVKGVKVSKCQTKCRARKFAYKLYLKYIYFKSSKRHIWWCTLTLWHFDTLTPCSIAYAFPKKTSYLVTTSMLFGTISINCHIGVQDICNYLEALASERKSGCQLTVQATNTRLLSNTTKGSEGKTLSHPFFIVHHSATIVIYSSHYWVNGEFQRISEKNREI